ncbi:DUF1778 domain-containing protein [Aliidiomarina iranensis]|uniref:DUF1778 domain-containing protein n=1 Tax=Aliidiomarina iranensis TaxID=1434071 RepID=A0A432VPT6_9GAMM|nr:DUF1778 domain-containing protein [Aliidiomarina iranensis]RUO18191.1 DUF1778 domain-containing protein [Aliidiomarina iranensis]
MSVATDTTGAASKPSMPARIELKTNAKVKAELERAAAISGISLTAFVIQQAADAAKRIVNEADTVRLNEEAWQKLNEVIDTPPQPTQALKDLMKL